MESKPLNRSLHVAKATKQDEFYTQLSDIEKEMRHYIGHFDTKTVLCNCDDPKVSNFFNYFSHNFEKLKLKKLITSDCDFRSEECIKLLKQADIVVTNPPFSLFREYVEQLIEHKKKFIIIGNQNAISYKEIFGLIKGDKIWLGYTHPVAFVVPDHYEMREVRSWRDENGTNWRSFGNTCWFTNLDIAKRHEELVLDKKYSPAEYPKYENYDAIEVSRYTNIPGDYGQPMGVPVTFLSYYNPSQFEILGSSRVLARPMSEVAKKGSFQQGGPRFYLTNTAGAYRRMYDRLVIRNKQLLKIAT